MKEKTNGLTNDKLFHCWASCEIGNDCSEAFSIFLGVLKEFGDRLSAYSNVFDLDEFKKTIRDSEEDEEADMMGIECKKRGGDCKCCCAEFYDTF
jgi:hypothetical protein